MSLAFDKDSECSHHLFKIKNRKLKTWIENEYDCQKIILILTSNSDYQYIVKIIRKSN